MSEVKPVPAGMHTLTPIWYAPGKAIAFYCEAFGAEEVSRLPGPDGRIMHAMIRIGDSPVMLVDEFPQRGFLGPRSLGGSPVTLHLYVDQVDEFVARAVAAGANITMPLEDTFWGDRYCKLDDPFGHHWSVASRICEVSPEEIQRALAEIGGS